MSAAQSSRPPPSVLFDLDGTLTDSGPGIVNCALYALRRFNETRGAALPIPEPRALRFLLGPPLRESFVKLAGPEAADALLAFYRERYESFGLLENSVFPNIASSLEALRAKGSRLLVATSKPEHYARRILDHFDLSRFFAAIHGAQPDGTRANKGALIAYVLDRYAIDPARAAMIGDREHDILGAKANGVRGVGALWGYGSREELQAAGADPIVSRPGDLAAALNAVFSGAA
ncbi:MAG TPA: HAD hydrolase-like protein [Roseiarcus sp.]|nr:HAD hydrolase-like protein [Roseiarcus sp.]